MVVNGGAALEAGTTVTGDVRTLDGTVSQAPGATIGGTVSSLDADLAALGVLLVPVFVLLLLGMGIATIALALLVAAFAARQVRSVGSLIAQEPGPVLVAGIVGAVALPILAMLLIATVVGAPIGLAMLSSCCPHSRCWPGSWPPSGSVDGSWPARVALPSRTARTSPRSSASSSWRSPGCSPS